MNKKYWFIILGVLFIGFLLWFFRSIIAYVFIAAVFSLIGQPIVKLFNRIKIGKFKFPNTLSAFLTLLILLSLTLGLISIFIPIIAYEAQILSKIDVNNFMAGLRAPINSLQSQLADYNLISSDFNFENAFASKLHSIVSITRFSDFFSSFFNFAGSLLVGIFAVSFITFFFLKDEKMFVRGIMLVTPTNYQDEIRNVLASTKSLLTRYFIGMVIDIILVISMITLGFSVLGIKNALLIGFFAGIMNIVPYIGPIIGATVGVFMGLSTNLTLDFSSQMFPLIIKMIVVFIVVNLIDALLLQPFIYSNSVKAHPLEVFIVILMASSIAGIPGMILAIPSYTVLRILAKEFFNGYRIVRKLTENI